MIRKISVLALCFVALLTVWHFSLVSSAGKFITVQAPATPPVKTVTVGWTGDMVPSSDIGYNLTVLNTVTKALQQPDLMMGNLEGTFAHAGRTSKCIDLGGTCFAFQGDSSFADTLKAAGFDFVSLINNHSRDYGTAGLKDTEAELDRVGLAYISPDKPTTSITVKGVTIGIMGLSSTEPTAPIDNYAYIAHTVQALKKHNDIVIVIFHGGTEGALQTGVPGTVEYMGSENRGNVMAVAYTAINAGADLVLGSGPHVLRKIEWYHDKPIAYSLGNFVGGKGRLLTGSPQAPSGQADSPQAPSPLSLGGIFTTTFANNPTTNSELLIPKTTAFTSVLLSKDGSPDLDPTNQAQQLLTSLSGPVQ
jgi:hypothetical protein